MKKMILFALALALLLSHAAFAEPSEALKGVYDALLAEDSSYSQVKALYIDYFPGTEYQETLTDDGFTLSVTGNEYMNGSWTFTQAGDDLTVSLAGDDFGGVSQMSFVVDAISSYYGMNANLVNSYVTGLNAHDMQSGCYGLTSDDDGTLHVRMRIAGPWDMPELSEMVLDEAVLDYDPLGEEATSMGTSCGKLMMVANGSADALTLLVGEYGGLDELALKSMANIVGVLKPRGYEAFLSDYTVLQDAQAAGYSVTLNADLAAVGEIIDDASADYSYALIRFGESGDETAEN